jgi:hypothetical protein
MRSHFIIRRIALVGATLSQLLRRPPEPIEPNVPNTRESVEKQILPSGNVDSGSTRPLGVLMHGRVPCEQARSQAVIEADAPCQGKV